MPLLIAQEPVATILLHPVAVVALAIPWHVPIRPKQAWAAVWKGCRYPVSANATDPASRSG